MKVIEHTDFIDEIENEMNTGCKILENMSTGD